MGDVRYMRPYTALRESQDRAAFLGTLPDADVIAALAAASMPGAQEPYLANILATEAQNRLRRARAMVEHVDEGLIEVDLDGRCVDANPAAIALIGRGIDELRGRLLSAIVGLRDASGGDEGVQDDPFRAAGLQKVAGEGRIRRPDGLTRAIGYLGCPVMVDDRSVGAVLVLRDITEAAARQAALAHAEARYRTLMDAVPGIGLALLSAEGVVESWNKGASALLGLHADQVVGRHVRGTYLPEDQANDLAEQELAYASRQGRARFDGARAGAGGERVAVRSWLARIPPEGPLRGFALVLMSPPDRAPVPSGGKGANARGS